MINLIICIISLIVGIYLTIKRHRIVFKEFKKEPWWIQPLSTLCFIMFGFFIMETIKYFTGIPTLIF